MPLGAVLLALLLAMGLGVGTLYWATLNAADLHAGMSGVNTTQADLNATYGSVLLQLTELMLLVEELNETIELIEEQLEAGTLPNVTEHLSCGANETLADQIEREPQGRLLGGACAPLPAGASGSANTTALEAAIVSTNDSMVTAQSAYDSVDAQMAWVVLVNVSNVTSSQTQNPLLGGSRLTVVIWQHGHSGQHRVQLNLTETTAPASEGRQQTTWVPGGGCCVVGTRPFGIDWHQSRTPFTVPTPTHGWVYRLHGSTVSIAPQNFPQGADPSDTFFYNESKYFIMGNRNFSSEIFGETLGPFSVTYDFYL
jgi:hypothetical protein